MHSSPHFPQLSPVFDSIFGKSLESHRITGRFVRPKQLLTKSTKRFISYLLLSITKIFFGLLTYKWNYWKVCLKSSTKVTQHFMKGAYLQLIKYRSGSGGALLFQDLEDFAFTEGTMTSSL